MSGCLCGHFRQAHFYGGKCRVCFCLIFEPLPAGWAPAKVDPLPEPAKVDLGLPALRTDIELPEWAHR